MLVLSRREDDKILFPSLGISVQILRVDGNKVRVGIDAPRDVRVLRHELAGEENEPFSISHPNSDAQRNLHLKNATQALQELQELSNATQDAKTEHLMLEIFHHLKGIDNQIAAGPSGKSQNPSAPREDCKSPRALLVDDNANESRLLASYLRTKRYDVDLASNGQEALDYLDVNRTPDIVLLDMQMPKMDGATAIRRMRANNRLRTLKVFAVSGGDPTDYGVEVGPEGVDGWFPKPLDPEALVFRLAFDANVPGDSARCRGEMIGA